MTIPSLFVNAILGSERSGTFALLTGLPLLSLTVMMTTWPELVLFARCVFVDAMEGEEVLNGALFFTGNESRPVLVAEGEESGVGVDGIETGLSGIKTSRISLASETFPAASRQYILK